MTIMEFIQESLLIVVPTLYILGVFIKKTNVIRDELIPIILTVIGVLLCAGLEQSFAVEVLIQGVLCAGTTVLGNQYIKQFDKLKGDD